MKNKEKDTPLKNTIKSIIGKLGDENRGRNIQSAWEDVVGRDKASHTKLVSFRKGRLVVTVSDSTRLYELTLDQRRILKEVNAAITKKTVKEIRFKIGVI